MNQIYKITYPTGKTYIGKDSVGSHRYFGSPNMDFVNNDFENLPDEIRKDYTIRKQILWESKDCSESELWPYRTGRENPLWHSNRHRFG